MARSLLGIGGMKPNWQYCSIGDLSAFPAQNTPEKHIDQRRVCQNRLRDATLLQLDQKHLLTWRSAASELFRHKHKFLILFFFFPLIQLPLQAHTIWVKGRKQRLPHVSSPEPFTQKGDSSSAEMTLQKTRGFHSRVAQGSSLRSCTRTTEGRAKPPDRNITQQKPLPGRSQRGLSGKWSDLSRIANTRGTEGLCRDASLHIGTFHTAKGSLVCWEPCFGTSADKGISPWRCGFGWSWCFKVRADTQPQSCPTTLLFFVGTRLPTAASGSSKPWHKRVLSSFTCVAPTKVGKYLLKTTQKNLWQTIKLHLYLRPSVRTMITHSFFLHKGNRLMHSGFILLWALPLQNMHVKALMQAVLIFKRRMRTNIRCKGGCSCSAFTKGCQAPKKSLTMPGSKKEPNKP